MRRWRRHRFGAAAQKLTVRPHVAWYWRLLGLIAVLSLSLALGMWVYDAGRRFAGFDKHATDIELAALRERAAALEEESAKLRAGAASIDSTLKIERTAQEKLAQQVKLLEGENARLKEDLAYIEDLSAKDRTEEGVAVYRFKVEPAALPGEYRYRLLVIQGGSRDRQFQGRLQLVLSLQQSGRSVMLTLPEEQPESAAAYRITFKHLLRAEGNFRIDPTAKVQSAQVRVLDSSGKARAMQVFASS